MKPGQNKFRVGDRVVVTVTKLYQYGHVFKRGDICKIYDVSYGDSPYTIVDDAGHTGRYFSTKQIKLLASVRELI